MSLLQSLRYLFLSIWKFSFFKKLSFDLVVKASTSEELSFFPAELLSLLFRPIKKLNYTRQTNRASWRPTRRKVENQSKTEKQDNDGGEKLFQTRNLKPKSITVIAKDDSSNRARIILNRKTAMNYESVLQTISDILQMNNGPVKDLYTVEGKKVRLFFSNGFLADGKYM